MKKILFIIFFISVYFLEYKVVFAESKLSDKIWGAKDCSQYSTKTLSGLSDFVKCKKGLEPSEHENFFKSLKWKKKNKEFDFSKPCDEYSTKTVTGLAKKIKCKRAKKN